MKKFITLILVAAMVLTLGTMSVSAATQTNTNNATGDVNAKYNNGGHAATYSIDITWGAMQFDYNANETWDTSNHKWVVSETAAWSANDDSITITVKNNSSVAVEATFAFAAESTYSTVSGAFTSSSEVFSGGNKLTIPVASENTAATSHVVSFMPAGAAPSSLSSYTKIGTITITLAATNIENNPLVDQSSDPVGQ